MTTEDKAEQVLADLRHNPENYTEEELREIHRAFDASLLIVLRAIVEIGQP